MALLEGSTVRKDFGGLRAVNDVEFEVFPGEILGLIGPNGAGKSTLVNLISGTLKLTKGKILFEGQDISKWKPYQRARLGIARTYQNVQPFFGLTVRESVCAAAIFGKNRLSIRQGFEMSDELLDRIGLKDKKDRVFDDLNLEDKKRLELAKALALNPKLLLLDELIAGLSPDQVRELVAIVQDINRQGVTIIFIEHVMRVVMNLCHRIMVLHFGSKIAMDVPSEIVANQKVRMAYLGETFKSVGKDGLN